MSSHPRKKALVIAISEYEDKFLDNLEFCKNDGIEMQKILIELGYSVENALIGKINGGEFKKALIDFFRRDVEPTDTLLVYLTGHGLTDDHNDGFFCTSNMDTKIPDEYGIPFRDLTTQMDKTESQRVIGILDCCHSGAALQSNVGRAMSIKIKEKSATEAGRSSLKKEFEQGQGRCILASSLSNKVSFGMQDKPFSAFTYYILEGLKPNKETVDEQGCVTPEKLSIYVSKELKKRQGKNYQKPVRHMSITDKLILASHPEIIEKRESLDEESFKKIIEKEVEKKFQERERKIKQNNITQTPSMIKQGSNMFIQLEKISILSEHTGVVSAVTITPDGTKAVSGSYDKTIRVWDINSGQCILTLRGHTNGVSAVTITPDGTKIISASHDKTLKVWDINSGQCILTLRGHTNGVSAVTITPDGTKAVSGSKDGDLIVWDLNSGKKVQIMDVDSVVIYGVEITPDGTKAVSGSKDGDLIVWDLNSGKKVLAIRSHSGWRSAISSVVITPDGKKAISASWDKTLKVWDINSGQELLTLRGHTNGVSAVTITPDGTKIISASHDKTLKVWDINSGQELLTLRGHTEYVSAVTITPDGTKAVSGSNDKTIRVWKFDKK